MTSKRLGLRSEASARFERGVDPNLCHAAADRVAQLLEGTRAATSLADPIDSYPGRKVSREVLLSLGEVPRHLGIELQAEEIAGLLSRLDFQVSGKDPLTVIVPSRRPDVTRSVDLIEEVARLHGFDRIPDRVARGTGGGLPPFERNLRLLRTILVGAGYFETMTFSFIGPEDLDAMGLPPEDPRRNGIAVSNPLRDEEGVMRTTLLPGLLKSAAVNVSRKISDVNLFETGKVFLPGDGSIPDQPERLGFIGVGRRNLDWGELSREVDFRDATGLWFLIANGLNVQRTRISPIVSPAFHPGRAAQIIVADETIGTIGELHSRVTASFGLEGRVIAGEIALDNILKQITPFEYRPPSQYPPIIFDLAFEAEETLPAGSILEAIDIAASDVLESRAIFDLFSGDPIPQGRKSIAVRLTLRSHNRTLTDKEVTPIRRRIVREVETRTGAELRGEA